MFKKVFQSGIRASYNVSDNYSFLSDPWKVYPATHKASGDDVSVFIFDKAEFESKISSWSSSSRNSKVVVSETYELLRSEVWNLTKIKHPHILNVIEVLEETKLKFIFVTEPILCTLEKLDFSKFETLSLQKGLLEVCESLEFLHNKCSIVHLNIQPSAVFMNNKGDFKLGGFRFIQKLSEMTKLDRENFFLGRYSSVLPFMSPNFNYTAPELVIGGNDQKLGTENDTWSLGLLIYYLFNRGESFFNCLESGCVSDFKAEYQTFRAKAMGRKSAELRFVFKDIPQELYPSMPKLLSENQSFRLPVQKFMELDYFKGSIIGVIRFVDEFNTKTTEERLIFTKGVAENSEILRSLPTTFKSAKLLPLLVDSIKSEASLARKSKPDEIVISYLAQSLNLIFIIGETVSKLTFHDKVYQLLLRPARASGTDCLLISLSSLSSRVAFSIISHLKVLLKMILKEEVAEIVKSIANDCVKMMPNGIDSESDQIELAETFLGLLLLVCDLFDYSYLRNILIPLICQIFKTTVVLSIKLQTIQVFRSFIGKNVIDDQIIIDQIIPLFESSKGGNKDIVHQILLLAIDIINNKKSSIELEVFVDEVLRHSTRLAFGCNSCSRKEFSDIMSLVGKIQTTLAQRKLEEIKETLPSSKVDFNGVVSGSFDLNWKISNVPLTKKTDSFQEAPKLKNQVVTEVKETELRALGDRFSSSFSLSKPDALGNENMGNLLESNNRMNHTSAASPSFKGNLKQIGLSWSPLQPETRTTSQKKVGNVEEKYLDTGKRYPPGFSTNTILQPSRKDS